MIFLYCVSVICRELCISGLRNNGLIFLEVSLVFFFVVNCESGILKLINVVFMKYYICGFRFDRIRVNCLNDYRSLFMLDIVFDGFVMLN